MPLWEERRNVTSTKPDDPILKVCQKVIASAAAVTPLAYHMDRTTGTSSETFSGDIPTMAPKPACRVLSVRESVRELAELLYRGSHQDIVAFLRTNTLGELVSLSTRRKDGLGYDELREMRLQVAQLLAELTLAPGTEPSMLQTVGATPGLIPALLRCLQPEREAPNFYPVVADADPLLVACEEASPPRSVPDSLVDKMMALNSLIALNGIASVREADFIAPMLHGGLLSLLGERLLTPPEMGLNLHLAALELLHTILTTQHPSVISCQPLHCDEDLLQSLVQLLRHCADVVHPMPSTDPVAGGEEVSNVVLAQRGRSRITASSFNARGHQPYPSFVGFHVPRRGIHTATTAPYRDSPHDVRKEAECALEVLLLIVRAILQRVTCVLDRSLVGSTLRRLQPCISVSLRVISFRNNFHSLLRLHAIRCVRDWCVEMRDDGWRTLLDEELLTEALKACLQVKSPRASCLYTRTRDWKADVATQLCALSLIQQAVCNKHTTSSRTISFLRRLDLITILMPILLENGGDDDDEEDSESTSETDRLLWICAWLRPISGGAVRPSIALDGRFPRAATLTATIVQTPTPSPNVMADVMQHVSVESSMDSRVSSRGRTTACAAQMAVLRLLMALLYPDAASHQGWTDLFIFFLRPHAQVLIRHLALFFHCYTTSLLFPVGLDGDSTTSARLPSQLTAGESRTLSHCSTALRCVQRIAETVIDSVTENLSWYMLLHKTTLAEDVARIVPLEVPWGSDSSFQCVAGLRRLSLSFLRGLLRTHTCCSSLSNRHDLLVRSSPVVLQSVVQLLRAELPKNPSVGVPDLQSEVGWMLRDFLYPEDLASVEHGEAGRVHLSGSCKTHVSKPRQHCCRDGGEAVASPMTAVDKPIARKRDTRSFTEIEMGFKMLVQPLINAGVFVAVADYLRRLTSTFYQAYHDSCATQGGNSNNVSSCPYAGHGVLSFLVAVCRSPYVSWHQLHGLIELDVYGIVARVVQMYGRFSNADFSLAVQVIVAVLNRPVRSLLSVSAGVLAVDTEGHFPVLTAALGDGCVFPDSHARSLVVHEVTSLVSAEDLDSYMDGLGKVEADETTRIRVAELVRSLRGASNDAYDDSDVSYVQDQGIPWDSHQDANSASCAVSP